MGGGLSSLSKICVIGPPTRDDADVDYTFAQVQIRDAAVDYTALCGNMTSTIGPFAVDEGLIPAAGSSAAIRIHNTNTNRVIVAHFPLDGGVAAVEGDLAIPGVAGTGAPIRLDFLDPAGASTGALLPTGAVVDLLEVPGHGAIEASMVDASNACVFVRAVDLGLEGAEMPEALDADSGLMDRLAAIRLAASVRMGIARDADEARQKRAIPFVGFVAPARPSRTLAGERIEAAEVDVTARIVSNGQLHRALPLAASNCLGVAAQLEGSVVHSVTRAPRAAPNDVRVAMPSGILRVSAEVARTNEGWRVARGGFFRTQRRLFEGNVLVPARRDRER
jgi:2-methylaconitate cis-trans-isomerase PrpF